MTADNVVRLNPKTEHALICTTCGAHGVGSCGHNTYVSAGKAAEKAVAEHPEKSDRAIADELGVSHPTVAAARRAVGKNFPTEAVGHNCPPETRVGRDGKKYKARKPRHTAPVKDEIIAQADLGLSSNEIAAGFGINGRAVRHEIEDERIRREAFNELLGASAAEKFSDTGKLKIEDAIRIHKERLNKAHMQQVNEEVIKRIAAADDATRKQNTEMRQENLRLSQMLNQRAIFTEQQYNKLMMCVHPDNSASEEVRREMQAFLNDKNVRRRLVKA